MYLFDLEIGFIKFNYRCLWLHGLGPYLVLTEKQCSVIRVVKWEEEGRNVVRKSTWLIKEGFV